MRATSVNYFLKNKVLIVLLCVSLASLGINACTQQQMAAAGGGIVAGGAALLLTNGRNLTPAERAAIVAGAAAAGTAAGWLIAGYLSPDEQKKYESDTNQRLKQTPENKKSKTEWRSGPKKITDSTSSLKPLEAVIAEQKNHSFDREVLAQKYGIQADSQCRYVASTIYPDGKAGGEQTNLYCRDMQGDYVRIPFDQVAKQSVTPSHG
jgi:hypothetical protein